MNTFFSVLRKERRIMMTYGLFTVLFLITGVYTVTDAVLYILQGFIVIVTAHEQYNSILERLMCMFLASFLIFVTFFVGVESGLILVEILFSIFLGLMLLGVRRLTIKKS